LIRKGTPDNEILSIHGVTSTDIKRAKKEIENPKEREM
jgi:hypothetical protein